MDYSATTIAAARERHDGSAVTYVTGDVGATGLPDGSVDGVWCERVVQHVADADRVIGEFTRVTRPGGRVCLIDTDWDSMAFDGPPPAMSAAVLGHLEEQFTRYQREMGRTLRRRLVTSGLVDVRATPVTCHFGTPESAAVVLPMVNPRVPIDAGMWPPGERAQWQTAVAEAGARGDFLAVLTIWVVSGTVRSPGSVKSPPGGVARWVRDDGRQRLTGTIASSSLSRVMQAKPTRTSLAPYGNQNRPSCSMPPHE